jgi:hypothetical protein
MQLFHINKFGKIFNTVRFLLSYNRKTKIISRASRSDVLLVTVTDCHIEKGKGKGKPIPLQAWTGPEGSRRLRLTDF